VPVSVHVGFVTDKAALGQVFLRVLRFSPVSIISPSPHTHIPSGERTIGPLVAVVQTYFHPVFKGENADCYVYPGLLRGPERPGPLPLFEACNRNKELRHMKQNKAPKLRCYLNLYLTSALVAFWFTNALISRHNLNIL
jgi:hypothetical protein